MQYEIRALKLGEVLDQAIKLTQNHFKLLFGIMAIGVVPMTFATGLYTHILGFDDPQKMARPGGFDPSQLVALLIGLFVIQFFFLLVVMPLSNAAVMHALSACYLSQPVTIGESYQVAARRYWSLLGTGLLWMLVLMGGLLLLIIPYFMFMFWYALWQQIVVIEHRGGWDALRRSHALMKGNYGAFFVLILVVGIATGAASGAAGAKPFVFVRLILTSLVQAAVMVFSTAAYVVFYFSCRCKYENFDLEILAQSVEQDIQLEL
jgi:hypothetical protein